MPVTREELYEQVCGWLVLEGVAADESEFDTGAAPAWCLPLSTHARLRSRFDWLIERHAAEFVGLAIVCPIRR